MSNKERDYLVAINEELTEIWLQTQKDIANMEKDNTQYYIKQGYYSGISFAQGKLEKFLDENK